MPPRIPLLQCLRAQSASVPISSSVRAFSNTTTQQASNATQARRYRDPYAIAQARARKAANISRQEVLKQERGQSLGDPVRSIETPFLRSLDEGATTVSTHSQKQSPDGVQNQTKDGFLNFYLSESELNRGVDRSKWLMSPTEKELNQPRADDFTSSVTPEERAARLRQDEATATEALRRISSLSLGSSQDRLRANKQRCIEEFGRHSTDQTLPPRAKSTVAQGSQPTKVPRVGADTGSSEVQIAILTAKIRTLAEFVQTRGRTDRVNKRNLRLLVHRRQKLLQYLRRKERGGPRWQHLVEKLGITDGMWKGEITLGP